MILAQVDPSMLRGDELTTAVDSGIVHLAGPSVDWMALLPLLILMVGGLLMLTVSSLVKSRIPRGAFAWATVVLAAAALVSVVPLWSRVQDWGSVLWITTTHSQPGAFSTLAGSVGIDGFGLFVIAVLCVAVILAALLADDYLRREGMDGPEFYVLLLLSASGGVIMAMANNLIVLFIGIETLSLAVYVLSGMHLKRIQSQESGLKYFILGGFSSAFLLYGIALIYGATGSVNLVDISQFMSAVVPIKDGLLLMGLVLMLVGLAFKIAAVPFHAWSPDVYDGAPTPAVAWMSAGVKAAAAAALVRVFMLTFTNYAGTWKPIVYVIAILSMVLGAALATVQSNVKRMLAYSSISHAGFILMAIQADDSAGTTAVAFYIAVYTFMVAGSFGIATLVGRRGDGHHQLSDYRGLGRTNPVLAGSFVILLLAQAGIPFTAGFFAKFLAVQAAAESHAIPLAIIAMVSATISAFLYLRVIVAMFLSEGDDGDDGPTPAASTHIRVPFAAGVAIGLCVVASLVFGLFPNLLEGPARDATPVLVKYDRPVQVTDPSILGG